MAAARHQQLPSAGPEREALRAKGQFWTPDWVADAMVGFVLGGGATEVFDPAVGGGVFLRAAKKHANVHGTKLRLSGAELFPEVLEEASRSGLTDRDLRKVEVRNFVLDPPPRTLPAIVANPPYVRHHRIPPENKAYLRGYAKRLTGRELDGRAGLHVFFLLRALELLADGGRLAFILPADICEGVFATHLWGWIARQYRVDGVVTFDPEATPFPGVDTNAIVFFISRQPPLDDLAWARCVARGPALSDWVASGFDVSGPADVLVHVRPLAEALQTGLSRPPSAADPEPARLSEYARVVRGIATGANEFFLLTGERARQLRIPSDYVIRAVGRTRDATEPILLPSMMDALEAAGRPTYLLNPDGRPLREFPESVRSYLVHGEALGLPERVLIKSRRPWYKMEKREVPPFLFAYLGRRNTRFIRNEAGVVPLTGFLCVYPNTRNEDQVARLWRVLQHRDTVANLSLVGKSYGGGAIKVEPRALERLPLPAHVRRECGLAPVKFARDASP